jgi:hypothetical protein
MVVASSGNNFLGFSQPHVAATRFFVFTVTYSHVTLTELWMSRRNIIIPASYPAVFGFQPRDRLCRLKVFVFLLGPSKSVVE